MRLMSILGHHDFSCVRLTKYLIMLVVICKNFPGINERLLNYICKTKCSFGNKQ